MTTLPPSAGGPEMAKPDRSPLNELPIGPEIPRVAEMGAAGSMGVPGAAGTNGAARTVGNVGAVGTTTSVTDSYEELITCPECGTTTMVDMGQRRAEDFCGSCDFPLFWARSSVVLSSGEETGASLRRLPGTVGRAATAALNCPHCNEPNSPVALICIRCDGDLHPAPLPPPPEPLPYLPPPPPPEPEPEQFAWWWIVIGALVLLVVAGIVVWGAQYN